MAEPDYSVLFRCTGNSARSIHAEAILNHFGSGRFSAFSAGNHPTGTVNQYALALLQQMGLPTAGLRSKAWDEFALAGASELDFVITVCDGAAGEVCPVWPGQPVAGHWSVADPTAVQGSDAAKTHAIRDAFWVLERRIQLFLSLPVGTLDRMRLHEHVRQIGHA